MNEWEAIQMSSQKASYSEEQIQPQMYITRLTRVDIPGKNVYKVEGLDHYVQTFADQRKLVKFLDDNQYSVLALQFLHRSNTKFSYNVRTPDNKIVNAVTIAKATVLLEGTEEDERHVYVTGSGITAIE